MFNHPLFLQASLWRWDRLLQRAFPCAVALAIAALAWGFFQISRLNNLGKAQDLHVLNPLEPLEYSEICTGIFSLSGNGHSQSLKHLFRDLVLIGLSTRPDLPGNVILKWNAEDKTVAVPSGEMIFLELDGSGRWIQASEKKSVSLRPIILDSSHVGLEYTLEQEVAQHSLVVKKQVQHTLEKEQTSQEDRGELPVYIQEIARGKYFGKDLLVEKYGGPRMSLLKTQSVLQLGEEGYPKAFFLAKGDLLIWKENRWHYAPAGNTQGYPLMRIGKIEPDAIHCEIWDQSGFIYKTMRVEKEKKRSHPKIDCLFTSFRSKTQQQFSCLSGKRRILLREGDWLLKGLRGWRVLRRSSEIDGVLTRSLAGELLIIDKLILKDNNLLVRGNWFDEDHCVSIPIEWSIVNEQKKELKSRKRTYRSIQKL